MLNPLHLRAYGTPGFVSRVNLTSMAVDATVPTPDFSCFAFGFDDAIFGRDSVVCAGQSSDGQAVCRLLWFRKKLPPGNVDLSCVHQVYQVSFGAGFAKAIGTYPSNGLANDLHVYDPTTHVFYVMQPAGSSGVSSVFHLLTLSSALPCGICHYSTFAGIQSVVNGISVPSGQLTISYTVTSPLMYAGPVAVDPYSGTAYTVVMAQQGCGLRIPSILVIVACSADYSPAFTQVYAAVHS
jgi:hypothetical protein